jgi:hypothetical protein
MSGIEKVMTDTKIEWAEANWELDHRMYRHLIG